MEVAPSLRSREAAGLGWGPCPFGSRLQLIWGHLQKKCLLSDHEGQGAWGTLLPPACGPVLLSCTDPPLGCPPGRHPVPSVGTGPSHGVRRKLPSRVCPGTLSSHGSLGPCPPPPPPPPRCRLVAKPTPWLWAYRLIATDGPPPPHPARQFSGPQVP